MIEAFTKGRAPDLIVPTDSSQDPPVPFHLSHHSRAESRQLSVGSGV